jgi:hypothetical protein
MPSPQPKFLAGSAQGAVTKGSYREVNEHLRGAWKRAANVLRQFGNEAEHPARQSAMLPKSGSRSSMNARITLRMTRALPHRRLAPEASI